MVTHWIKDKNGKEYSIRYSQVVGIQLASIEGIPANKIQKFLSSMGDWPIDRMFRLHWLAFKNGARKENREFDMSEEDFLYWLDDDETILPQVMRINEASQPDPQKKTDKKR